MADHTREHLIDGENPWPGLESYLEEDADFFHGRIAEIQMLADRVDHHTLTILFSSSGLGKTSLLKAGLSPMLRRRGLLPIYLRLDHSDDSPTPVQQVWSRLREHLHLASPYDDPACADKTMLWEWFHDTKSGLLSPSLRGVSPVLIFDQFEEMFTIGAGGKGSTRDEESTRFLMECADLAENCPPESLTERMESDEREGEHFDFDLANFRILITLREAYLPQLERLRNRMPSVMQNRLPLEPLSGKRAMDAVIGPGADLVNPEVAEKIVRFVGREQQLPLPDFSVEPPLLSLVCRELNRRRIDTGLTAITAELIEGNQEDILEHYYDDCFEGLPPKARHWVEDELLTKAGYRDSEAYETGQRRAGKKSVKQLIDARLLHLDFRGRIPRIELTHDVLAKVVDQSRAKRYEREARQKAEEEQKLAHERESKFRRERLQARIAAGVMGALALLSVSLLSVVIIKWKDAEKAEENAKTQKLEAKKTKIASVEFSRLMSGDELIDALRDAGELKVLSDVYTNAIGDLGNGDPQLQFGLFEGRGRIHHAHGNYLKAVSDLNRALNITEQVRAAMNKKTTVDERVIRDRYEARIRFRLAIIRKEQNQHDEAESQLKIAIRLQDGVRVIPVVQEELFLKSQTAARSELADSYEEFGFMLLTKTKRYQEAEEHLRKSLDLHNGLLALPDPSRDWSAKRARTYTHLGSCLAKQKDRKNEAIDAYETGLKEFEALAELGSRHGQWKLAHETAILDYGEWLREAKELKKTEDYFETVIKTFDRLGKKHSGDACLKNTMAVGYLGKADFYSRRNEIDEADRLLRLAIDIQDSAVESHPSSMEAQRGASKSHEGLGNHLRRHGEYQGAISEYVKAISHMKKLIAKDSENKNLRNELAFLHDYKAFAYRDQGNLEMAGIEWNIGYDIRDELVADEDFPNAEWQLDLSRSHNYMGDLARLGEKPDFKTARDHYEKALSIREALYRKAPDDNLWKSRIAYCYGQMGRVNKDLGNHSDSITNHETALQFREDLNKAEPNNSTWAEDLATSHIELGEVQLLESDSENAVNNFKVAEEIRGKLVTNEPGNWDYPAGVAECEYRLGTVESLPSAERLKHLNTAIQNIDSLGEKVRVSRRDWIDDAKSLRDELNSDIDAKKASAAL